MKGRLTLTCPMCAKTIVMGQEGEVYTTEEVPKSLAKKFANEKATCSCGAVIQFSIIKGSEWVR